MSLLDAFEGSKKKKPSRKAKPVPAEPVISPDVSDIEMIAFGDGDVPVFDPENPTSIEIPHEDGSVTIEFVDNTPPPPKLKFDDNLADHIDDFELGRIVETLLEAIEQDERDRSEWLQQRADGLDLLGNKVTKPGGSSVGTTSTAVPGQSSVRDGLLGDACERFRANAFAELCPSEGPCKVMDFGPETADMDGLAESFEKDMNYYLTTTAREYYPDTNKMLWWTGYASGMFKKVYKCPLRNRPVSESVDGSDLIVPSNATDLHNAGRITHQINMRQSTMKRMQIIGAYRDVTLTAPTPQQNALQSKEADMTGMAANQQREQDQEYTVYECYTELNLPGFEHKIKGEETGLPLPYIVTIEKDSRTVLAIRRNWTPPANIPDEAEEFDYSNSEDEAHLPVAKIPFVLFPYSLGLGFYGTGLLHKLGNYAQALTAMMRITLDSGMFANFPGFLFAKPVGRQLQNEFRVPPGGGAPIDVSAVPGGNINNAVMPLPYKPVDQGFVGFQGQVREVATRIGGTAEAPTGEGVINAPVGSVLAAIDQATRVEGGVHKLLYAAQKEELGLLKELFRDDPEALWRDNKRPAMGADKETRLARFKLALENCDLVPASDPNVPSHMHRLAKANTYLQMASQPQIMPMFNMQNVIRRWAGMVKIDDVENDFAQAQQPQPDPLVMAQLALKAREVAVKEQGLQAKVATDHAQIQSRESIEAAKIAAKQVGDATSEGGPDPLKIANLLLQDKKIKQQDFKIASDNKNAHEDRQSAETNKALEIASRVAVHPQNQPAVNSQIIGMAPFIKPAPQDHEMAAGGVVGDDGTPMADALDEIDAYLKSWADFERADQRYAASRRLQ